MTWQMLIPTLIGVLLTAIVIPSGVWLVNEVLSLRLKMIAIETRMDNKDEECKRHQRWAGDLQHAVARIDKNVTRLCQQAGVKETGE